MVDTAPIYGKVFEYFYKIASIPHGSGNTKALSDYCAQHAEKHGCRVYREDNGNLIVYVDGTQGYESSETVILQGHIDMVCDKTENCDKDMAREGVEVLNNGKYIFAKDTTLGSDNGIAVAYMLTLIEDKSIPHPPLEMLFTVDEEVGMLGARAIDATKLSSNKLINIDSEVEGILTVSCAGAIRAVCKIPFTSENTNGSCYKISISGLRGGHSGIEINSGRINSNKLLSRLLNFVSQEVDFKISSIFGGKKYNAIPKESEAVVCVEDKNKELFLSVTQKFINSIKSEKVINEPDLEIDVTQTTDTGKCMDSRSTRKAMFTLLQIPNGVQTMSPDIPNMVQTSLNLGILETGDEYFSLCFMLRSNASAGKQALVQKLKSFVEYLDGSIEFMSDYPAWEFKADSSLRNTLIESYTEMYGEPPIVTAIHAGLECGILAGKIPDMDAVSFGPNILHAHTPQEKIEIASAKRCWEYLKTVLKNLK